VVRVVRSGVVMLRETPPCCAPGAIDRDAITAQHTRAAHGPARAPRRLSKHSHPWQGPAPRARARISRASTSIKSGQRTHADTGRIAPTSGRAVLSGGMTRVVDLTLDTDSDDERRPPPKRQRTEAPVSCKAEPVFVVDSDDFEVQIIDQPRQPRAAAPAAAAAGAAAAAAAAAADGDSDEDLVITGDVGVVGTSPSPQLLPPTHAHTRPAGSPRPWPLQIANRDLPHLRHDCAVHKYAPSSAPTNALRCDQVGPCRRRRRHALLLLPPPRPPLLPPADPGLIPAGSPPPPQCYCWVCDAKASECEFWGAGGAGREGSHPPSASSWGIPPKPARTRAAPHPPGERPPRARPPVLTAAAPPRPRPAAGARSSHHCHARNGVPYWERIRALKRAGNAAAVRQEFAGGAAAPAAAAPAAAAAAAAAAPAAAGAHRLTPTERFAQQLLGLAGLAGAHHATGHAPPPPAAKPLKKLLTIPNPTTEQGIFELGTVRLPVKVGCLPQPLLPARRRAAPPPPPGSHALPPRPAPAPSSPRAPPPRPPCPRPPSLRRRWAAAPPSPRCARAWRPAACTTTATATTWASAWCWRACSSAAGTRPRPSTSSRSSSCCPAHRPAGSSSRCRRAACAR
jgi:hypothetical protein